MKNPRITAKDRNGIKGAIMRAFSRSELHGKIIDAAIISHSDPSRPRVKTWARCNMCKEPEAKSYFQVDHIEPKIPVHLSLEELTWDELIDRTWCDEDNLQAICERCHTLKTVREKLERTEHKRAKKKEVK